MANETFLLSGDQIATYSGSSVTYPSTGPEITLNGLDTLGDESSRFFLVRTQGDGDTITNGQFWAIYDAVDDGAGGLKPGATPVVSANYATPDGYEYSASDDDYQIFGLFGGTKFAINLDGFQGADSFTTSNDGEGDGHMQLSEISGSNPDLVVCFAGGTPIATAQGEIPVECLRVGDMVMTADHGPQPVRWIGRSRIVFSALNRHLRPVRIAAGAMGGGLPRHDVVVSPAHRMVVADVRSQLLFAEDEVLMPAQFLVNDSTIRRDADCAHVDYWHILFDRHEIVFASGLASESLHPGEFAVSTLRRAEMDELSARFPQFAAGDWAGYGPTARRSLRAFEAAALPGAGDISRSGPGGANPVQRQDRNAERTHGKTRRICRPDRRAQCGQIHLAQPDGGGQGLDRHA